MKHLHDHNLTDVEKEEAICLQKEFEWVIKKEVHIILKQLQTILMECSRRFPLTLFGNEGPYKSDKLILASTQDTLKTIVNLNGDSISFADIQLKVHRHHQHQTQTYKTSILKEHPWKLHQIQDAGNHLQFALFHIDNVDEGYEFKSSEEVLHTLDNILNCLQRGRSSLIVPRKRTIDDLMKSRNMKSLTPPLPEDLAISFYIQSHKLICAAYQLSNVQGTMKFEQFQAENSIPWLNEVLVLFTVALQLCQQLKDKINVFATYKDFTVTPHHSSATET